MNAVTVLLTGKKEASQLFEEELWGFLCFLLCFFCFVFFPWLYFESPLKWAVLLRMLNS